MRTDPVRIMASGDHHFDEHGRFSECVRIHAWMAEEVARRQPDVFLSGGDIYERASTPVERAAVADWLTQVAETCPVVIARGNHDRQRDAELLGRLKTRHPVLVEERAGVHIVGGLQVGVVAWPNRASIAAMVGQPLPPEALDDVARDLLRNVLRGLGAEMAGRGGPRLLLTHCMLDGAVTSVGNPLIGAELNVGLADLALADAPLVIAAHIHRPQSFAHESMEALYTGSPFRTAFGETEEKSIVYAEIKAEDAQWERIPTPARGMFLLEDEWISDAWAVGWHGIPDEKALRGSEVRCRYSVESDRRDAAKRAAAEVKDRLLAAGAVSVKLEEQVVATTRARTPEIASAKTLDDKLRLLWVARQTVPEPARTERLLTKVHELEGEVAA